MFRFFAVLTFSAAVVVQSFDRAFLVLDYYANTASFAARCENRAFPKMHCNGKCQLMKKLRAEEKKDRQNQGRKLENRNEVTPPAFFAGKLFLPFIQGQRFGELRAARPVDRSLSIFHPPGLV